MGVRLAGAVVANPFHQSLSSHVLGGEVVQGRAVVGGIAVIGHAEVTPDGVPIGPDAGPARRENIIFSVYCVRSPRRGVRIR